MGGDFEALLEEAEEVVVSKAVPFGSFQQVDMQSVPTLGSIGGWCWGGVGIDGWMDGLDKGSTLNGKN